MEVDCGFQAVAFGGLVVDSGGFRWIPVDCGFQAVDFGGLVVDSGGFRLIAVFRQTVLLKSNKKCQRTPFPTTILSLPVYWLM